MESPLSSGNLPLGVSAPGRRRTERRTPDPPMVHALPVESSTGPTRPRRNLRPTPGGVNVLPQVRIAHNACGDQALTGGGKHPLWTAASDRSEARLDGRDTARPASFGSARTEWGRVNEWSVGGSLRDRFVRPASRRRGPGRRRKSISARRDAWPERRPESLGAGQRRRGDDDQFNRAGHRVRPGRKHDGAVNAERPAATARWCRHQHGPASSQAAG